MKQEIKSFTLTEEEKSVVPPPTPKMSSKRTLKTALGNQYVRSIVLNKGTEIKMQTLSKTALDCRDVERSNLLQCPLNKEPTMRPAYLLQKTLV
jgi:hypothetical protein